MTDAPARVLVLGCDRMARQLEAAMREVNAIFARAFDRARELLDRWAPPTLDEFELELLADDAPRRGFPHTRFATLPMLARAPRSPHVESLAVLRRRTCSRSPT